MKNYNLKAAVVAGQIDSVNGSTVYFVDGDTLEVDNAFITQQMPVPGAYVLDGTKVMNKNTFEEMYCEMDSVDAEDTGDAPDPVDPIDPPVNAEGTDGSDPIDSGDAGEGDDPAIPGAEVAGDSPVDADGGANTPA